MKPMGRRSIRFPGKTDCHPGKGFENWWEADCDTGNREKARQSAKRDIKIETDETLDDILTKKE